MKVNLLKRQFFFIVSIIFIFISIGSLVTPNLSYGDHFTDANVMIAGENFAQFGFLQTLGIPYYSMRQPISACEGALIGCVDTHYPAFPYWINGLLQSLGLSDLIWFRIFGLLISLVGVIMLPQLFKQLGASDFSAYVGSFFVVLHPDFITYSDSFYHIPWGILWLILFGICWLQVLKTQKMKFYFFSLVIVFMDTWTTFEHFAWIPIFAFLVWLSQSEFRKNRRMLFFIFGIFLIPVCTLLLRVYHHSLFLGSFEVAVNDLLFAAGKRSQISIGQTAYNFQKRMGEFLLPLIPLIFYGIKKENWTIWRGSDFWQKVLAHKVLLVSLSLFFAPTAWALLMRQHFVVHGHPMVWYLPFYGFVIGALVEKIWKGNFDFSRFIVVLSLIIAALRALSSPQFNRWLPISARFHNQIANFETLQSEVGKLSKTLSSSIQLMVPNESTVMAYYSQRDFRFYDSTDPFSICKYPGQAYFLIRGKVSENTINRCLESHELSSPSDGFIIAFAPRGVK